MPETVAVIGAGALGLMAIKNFTEDGFDVTGFDTRPYVGGLWKDTPDATISVHGTTTFNSSRFRSAISDFPFDDDIDDYPTAEQMHRYLTSYSEHFDLTSKVQLNTKVIDLQRRDAKWELTLQPRDGPSRTELFDKVAVSTGSFFQPKRIKIEDGEKFTGEIIHSIDYHDPRRYINKNVLIVGVHATAQDVALSLKGSAKNIYMSHRGRLMMVPRYTDNGLTLDTGSGLRFILIQTFMMSWFPRFTTWIFDKLVEGLSRKAFPLQSKWNLKPPTSLAISPPLVGDNLYSLFESGAAKPVAGIKRITGPNGVLLTDTTHLNPIDAIILATGYDFAISFLPPTSPYQPYPTPGAAPYLYRNIFPLDPDPAIRNSLAFLGQGAITFPGFVAFELTIQSISQIWRGTAPRLPPLPEMQKWHQDNIAWRAATIARYGPSSTFYAPFVEFSDHIRWIDRTSGAGVFAHFDWAWFNYRSWWLWWSDALLYRACMRGVLTPAIWRLFDCGGRKVWRGAREQILRDNEALERARVRRLEVVKDKEQKKLKWVNK